MSGGKQRLTGMMVCAVVFLWLRPGMEPAARTGPVKWNPGHYARVTGDTPSIATIENTGIRHDCITGIIIRFPWKTLEPSKDVYNLNTIQMYLDYLTPLGKHLIIDMRERNYGAGQTNDALPQYFFDEGLTVTTPTGPYFIPNYGDHRVTERWIALMTAIAAAYDLHPALEGIHSGEQAVFGASDSAWRQEFVLLAQGCKVALPHTLFWAPVISTMFSNSAYTDSIYAAGCGEYLIDSPPHEIPDYPDGWSKFALAHPGEFPIKANGEIASWTDADSDPANGGPALYYEAAVTHLKANHVGWTTILFSTSSHPTARPNWWSDVIAYLSNNGNPRPVNTQEPLNIQAAAPPGQAAEPAPSQGEADVSIDKTMSWTAGSNVDSHLVYFGTTSPPAYLRTQADTVYNPVSLFPSTTYYWRIDEKNFTGVTPGVEWSFTTPLSTPAGGDDNVLQLPLTFNLYPNYPNPFNPATTVRFGLKNAVPVTVRIYDPMGRLVETLVHTSLPAGVHAVVWNATGRTSGVYFVHLEAGRFHQTRTVVFQK